MQSHFLCIFFSAAAFQFLLVGGGVTNPIPETLQRDYETIRSSLVSFCQGSVPNFLIIHNSSAVPPLLAQLKKRSKLSKFKFSSCADDCAATINDYFVAHGIASVETGHILAFLCARGLTAELSGLKPTAVATRRRFVYWYTGRPSMSSIISFLLSPQRMSPSTKITVVSDTMDVLGAQRAFLNADVDAQDAMLLIQNSDDLSYFDAKDRKVAATWFQSLPAGMQYFFTYLSPQESAERAAATASDVAAPSELAAELQSDTSDLYSMDYLNEEEEEDISYQVKEPCTGGPADGVHCNPSGAEGEAPALESPRSPRSKKKKYRGVQKPRRSAANSARKNAQQPVRPTLVPLPIPVPQPCSYRGDLGDPLYGYTGSSALLTMHIPWSDVENSSWTITRYFFLGPSERVPTTFLSSAEPLKNYLGRGVVYYNMSSEAGGI